MITEGTFSVSSKWLKYLPVYPPEGNMAVAWPPSFIKALATLMPPPPGSRQGTVHFNFFSGIKEGTVVLLSIQGLKVMVTTEGMLLN
jgi:hypothetical protein